jgi:hypothetical protein
MAQTRTRESLSEAGRKGMRARWGPQRVLRLDQLDPVTRDIVTAIVEARKNAAEAAARPAGQE